ncbi:MAG: serine/threonine protein kinase [Deltaproteobacteria bacterium]|nr:serine/threonine protein kinase [Deltaproteobacteria bacterium]
MRTLTFNRIVGSGAMGTVYHAELRVPRGFSRTCAVKVMKTSGPDHEHFRGRMRDEARLLGMLQDEQVLGVSEMVQIEGRDAVIMEFVEGVDFSEVIQTNPVPPRALAELGAEVAGTLYRAHSARHPQTGELLHVIHRDIKPANIMVTSRGGVRILDFGVARAAFASRESHTQGLVLGTLNYFPPEILVGNDPTPAVDIYGLGLTVWECATGRDWGAPRVQRVQFERRVDRRIEELGKAYAPLVAVLRQVLQWDPELRPDGGGLERMLLAASEECSGQGLRTWSRDVVPQLLSGRTMKVVSDPLLGRTIKIENPGTPAPAPPRRASAYNTFDDFGPPAAAIREPPPPAPAPQEPRRPPVRKPRDPREGVGGGITMWLIAVAGIVFGGALGVLLLIVILLVLLLVL